MMMAVVSTEWMLICALATTWAWLYHTRYHPGFPQVRTRARRAPMRGSNTLLDSKASIMRFVMIPGGILMAIFSVVSWHTVFAGGNEVGGASGTLALVSGAVLVGYIAMTGYEISLLRSGRRMVRPRAGHSPSPDSATPRIGVRPRPPTARWGSR